MKPIDEYTTVSDRTEKQLMELSKDKKMRLMQLILYSLYKNVKPHNFDLTVEAYNEVFKLNENKSLGLIKALADSCIQTLISK